MEPLSKLLSFRVWFLALLEAALVLMCYAAPVFATDPNAMLYIELEGGAERIGSATAIYLLCGYVSGFIRDTRTRTRLLVVIQICQLVGGVLLLSAFLTVLNPDLVLPQNLLLAGSALALVVMSLWRMFVRPRVWAAFGAQKVLVVGQSSALQAIVSAFAHDPGLGVRVVGSVETPGTPPVAEPVLGSLREMRRIIASVQPERIVIGSEIADTAALKSLLDAKAAGIQVETASQVYESAFARIDVAGLKPFAVIYQDELASRPASVALQSVYNNVLGLVVVVLALPVILLISLILRITSPGPVFSRTLCAGLHGIPFTLYRFNTGGPVGRLLEHYWLDALPQVLNIVRGEVALIGPRAERIEFDEVLAQLIPFYIHRQHVKPGLMGWSQLHCDPLPQEHTVARIEYDLYYIKHISVLVDVYILIRAAKKFLSGRTEEEDLVNDMAASHS